MNSPNPRVAAREMLLRLYEHKTQVFGQKPTRAQFYPVDIELAVELLGWEIRSLGDLRELAEPIAGRSDFQRKILYVDKNDPEGRWNFTVAHEIGHIVLKHSCDVAFRPDDEVRSTSRPETLGVRSRSSASNEKAANIFAAELLMPERAVKHEFMSRFAAKQLSIASAKAEEVLYNRGLFGKDVALVLSTVNYPHSDSTPLSTYFRVSGTAMRRRLFELGLVY